MMLGPFPLEEEEGGTPFEVLYGLDLARFGHSLDTPVPMMDTEVHGMPTGTSSKETSLETMDVNEQKSPVADDEQESGDVPHSPMTSAPMEL